MFRKLRNRMLLVNMTITTALLVALLSMVYLTTLNRIQAENAERLATAARREFFTSPIASAVPVAQIGGVTLSSTSAPLLTGAWGFPLNTTVRFTGNGREALREASAFSVAEVDTGYFSVRDGPSAAARSDDTVYAYAAESDTVHISATGLEAAMIRLAPVDLSHSFQVVLDSEGEVFRINSYIDLTEAECTAAAEAVWADGRDGGTYRLGDHTLMYSIEPVSQRFALVTDRNDTLSITSLGYSHRVTFLDITDSQATLAQLLTTVLAVGAAGLFLVFCISYFFAGRSIAPIAAAYARQKQFLADASHELKTPIAIIQANSDVLLANRDETVDSQRLWLDYIRAETTRMGGLVNTLLELARAEEGSPLHADEEFSMTELVNDAALTMEAVAFEKELHLCADVDSDVYLTACREDIGRVVLILLDNAIKYTEPGGEVRLTLTRQRKQTVCAVWNSGPVIPPDALPHLFDRFYRADSSRSSEDNSYGLGLAIAKTIVEGAGGTITAHSAPDAGTTFTVTL